MLELKLFIATFRYNDETRQLKLTATTEKEATEMFEKWIPIHKKNQSKYHTQIPDIELLKFNKLRKSKKNARYFEEDYYRKELEFLGMEEKE